ncbi:MAG: pre-16S rRNA-processing nuclease YqgF [Cyanobacteria bacterium]|nr:pre-16S rRNA-processing nuclease YqgF [Cyanobacteriota bacterium]MDW8201249.1 pre-16S rRNA-processing nuclease YqgF [Cyanobacteriota bacterium SKYGB_h_bin112]
MPDQPMILGFDPGRDKCGIAVMGVDRRLHYQDILPANRVLAELQRLQTQFPISLLVMGNQTTANRWKQHLQDLPTLPRVVMVDERHSTLEARNRYWRMYPARGLYRFIPQGLRLPPRPVDDIVAILLIERYLDQLTDLPP